jgi:cellobiose-specific phosphotransferase system component IIC
MEDALLRGSVRDGRKDQIMHAKPYGLLALMGLLHFGAMYLLMYAMVNTFGDVLPNLNQLYMAALMTAPMLGLEVLLMGGMYPMKRVNVAIVLGSVALLAGAFLMIRQQTAIGDAEFLRSMVPHHSGAILMCREAELNDPEIRKLCREIIEGQQREIDWMTAKLERLD